MKPVAKIALATSLLACVFLMEIVVDRTVLRASRPTSSILNERRADLVDRNGVVLATETVNCRVILDGKTLLSPSDRSRLLAADPALKPSTIDEIAASRSKRVLDPALPMDQCRKLRRLRLPGLAYYRATQRVYPRGSSAAHLIGFTNKADDGIAGAELAFDNELKVGGGAVKLSLDMGLQQLAEQTLKQAVTDAKAKNGALIVTRAATGEILAMASFPDFDLNDRAASTSEAQINRAIGQIHEFGSAFSPLGRAAYHSYPGNSHAYVGTLQKLGLLSTVNIGIPESARPLPTVLSRLSVPQTLRGYGIAVSPASLAQAYGALANGGLLVPLAIRPVAARPTGQRVLSAEVVETAMASLKASSQRQFGASARGVLVACGRTPTVYRGGYNYSRLLETTVALLPGTLTPGEDAYVTVLAVEGGTGHGCTPMAGAVRKLAGNLSVR
jgi:cell division protein FtsI (penicillin-binding protein 3)